MKKYWFLFALIFLLVGSVTIFGCAPEEVVDDPEEPVEVVEKTRFMTLASGSPGGVYFPLGAGLAKVITDGIDNVVVQSESTGASVENCRLVGSGQSNFAIIMGNVGYDAYMGQNDFEGDPQPIRALFNMYPGAQKKLTAADSGIETIADLVGKTVSVDAAGSGSEVMARAILQTAGIWDDINPVNLSMTEAADALRDGLIDALSVSLGYPSAFVEELFATMDLKYIPYDDELMDKAVSEHPYFFKGVIPATAHEGLQVNVPCLFVGNDIIVHEDMDEDFAYEVTKLLFQEQSIVELIGIHPQAKNMTLETGYQAGIPLHPGAERFFREVGVLK